MHLDVNHLIAGQHAVIQRLQHAFFHRRNIFARDHAAFDFIEELEAFARFVRFHR
ncbi:hypothetical protein D3C80_1981230 [compost metagenome]